jgi:hypothetical protein
MYDNHLSALISGFAAISARPQVNHSQGLKRMNGTVFNVGNPTSSMTMSRLVELHPNSVVGTFWLPPTPDDYEKLTCKWIDYVLEENQAQALLNNIDILQGEAHLYTHMIILLAGNPSNPGDYSFMAGVTRFVESHSLLKALAKHNIPAHTEVTYPKSFYDLNAKAQDYYIWSKLTLTDWEEYIRLTLVSNHGSSMLKNWWSRLAGQ